MNPNPNLRFTPEELVTIIRHLKLNLMKNDPILEMHGVSRVLSSQNN